jgi:hypothetical protein
VKPQEELVASFLAVGLAGSGQSCFALVEAAIFGSLLLHRGLGSECAVTGMDDQRPEEQERGGSEENYG